MELFFRWFKSIGHLGHLISHSSEGVLTHLYVTIIAVLLMYLHTGYRPSKYIFALLSQVPRARRHSTRSCRSFANVNPQGTGPRECGAQACQKEVRRQLGWQSAHCDSAAAACAETATSATARRMS
ncbi:MAG: hypothetical protein QGF59_28550 [Pirellulaceae bacterium]|nr:hypothetical protein [Pirellulaceae bacterium]